MRVFSSIPGKPGWPESIAGLCGLLCAALGAAVLAGWHTGNAALIRINAEFAPMQYPTAVCFLLAGLGLLFSALRLPRLLPVHCGGLTGAVGALMSVEYFTGWRPGIPGLPAGSPPSPMAAAFAMAGAAIALLCLPETGPRRRLLIWILASSVTALGLIALCAYRLGVRMVFMSEDSVGMAAHSAAGLAVLGIGLLAAQVQVIGWRLLPEDRWLPVPFGFGTIVAALMMWQALAADRTRALKAQAQVVADNVAADTFNRFTFSLRSLERIARRWETKGGAPYSQWYNDAWDCLTDQSVFEAVGHTNVNWKVDYVEADADAEPMLGRDFHQDTRWDAVPALTDAITHERMLVSPSMNVRGGDKGFFVFFPTFFPGPRFGGFVFASFRLADLHETILNQSAFTTCRIAFYEGDKFVLGDPMEEPAGDSVRAQVVIPGKQIFWRDQKPWKVVTEPKSAILAGGGLPVIILGLGVLLGGTVSATVWGLQRAISRTRMALAANVRLTAEIRERQLAEKELHDTLQAKKKSQALLESAGRIAQLGHWELPMGADGPTWSEITYNIHGLTPGTPVSLTDALNFYHPDDRPAISECVREAIEKGVAHEFEARLITASGRQLWVYSRGEPVKDEHGNVTAIHGVFQNIDDRRNAAELLKRRNQELEEATARAEGHARAKAEFLANMSHEIRTPMNAVLGMSELLMDGQLDAREREFAETIHSSGEVLLSLINDILDFSKIESGQLDLEHIPVNLRDCMESVMDLLAGQAAKKKLDLMGWIDPALPAAIIGDPTRLRQVLTNLVSNALKFTHEGEVFIKLSLMREESGPWLRVAVMDTGIGISPAGMERLFSAFSQVDTSTTRRFGGTGLGLAISQRLVQHMGGEIRVESELDKGSIFRFAIPLQEAAPPPGPLLLLPETEGLRVLIVDDNVTSRWILEQHCRSCCMVPVMAGGPGKALDLIRDGEPFDLAVIDSLMPEMDGYALAAEIRKLRGEASPRILILASIAAPFPDPKPADIAGVLNKPIKTGPLLLALRNAFFAVPPPKPQTESQPQTQPLPSAGGTNGADSAGGGEKPGTLRPLRILVAEDNPINQRVVALHLDRMGYGCVMAANGLEALQAVQDAKFDVLLLDVQMPEMDGLTAARELCRRYAPSGRPWMIALTANAFGSDRDECLAAGMNDYLSKPVRAGNLQRALQAAFDEKVKRASLAF
ncbi:MAG: two-component hybrid sensor and regulator [Verrucomicrobiales bacterium]|nr:two-component hybrid sensor and regulator [Verrucomicrobiales bacterium]